MRSSTRRACSTSRASDDTSQPSAANVSRLEMIDATQKNDAAGAILSTRPTSHGYSGKKPALAAPTGSSRRGGVPSRATRSYQTASHFCQTAAGLSAAGPATSSVRWSRKWVAPTSPMTRIAAREAASQQRGARPGAGRKSFSPWPDPGRRDSTPAVGEPLKLGHVQEPAYKCGRLSTSGVRPSARHNMS